MENNVFLVKEPEFRTVLINKVATNPLSYIKLMKQKEQFFFVCARITYPGLCAC